MKSPVILVHLGNRNDMSMFIAYQDIKQKVTRAYFGFLSMPFNFRGQKDVTRAYLCPLIFVVKKTFFFNYLAFQSFYFDVIPEMRRVH